MKKNYKRFSYNVQKALFNERNIEKNRYYGETVMSKSSIQNQDNVEIEVFGEDTEQYLRLTYLIDELISRESHIYKNDGGGYTIERREKNIPSNNAMIASQSHIRVYVYDEKSEFYTNSYNNNVSIESYDSNQEIYTNFTINSEKILKKLEKYHTDYSIIKIDKSLAFAETLLGIELRTILRRSDL